MNILLGKMLILMKTNNNNNNIILNKVEAIGKSKLGEQKKQSFIHKCSAKQELLATSFLLL